MIVVDASLAAKWLLPEANSIAALEWLRAVGEPLHAPDLVAVEVASALVRRANEDKGLTQAMLLANEKWLALLTQRVVRLEHSAPADVARAAVLAIDLGHPMKDCLYLVLAMRLGCRLATCDTRFAAKAAALWTDVEVVG
jgi:predicted nucleic acid-binding protein